MAARTAAARLAAKLARLSTPKSAANSAQASILIQRRGLAGGDAQHDRSKELLEKEERLIMYYFGGCFGMIVGFSEAKDKNRKLEKGHSDLEDACTSGIKL